MSVEAPPPSLRVASADDARAIADVHVAGWRATYRGLLPDGALDAIDLDVRERQWRARLEAPGANAWTIVASNNSHIVAFCSVGPCREPPDAAARELYAIYAHPQVWGQGIGYALFSSAVSRLETLTSALSLWVVEKNLRARAFYERQGMRLDGPRIEKDLLGTKVEEVRYTLTIRRE